MTGIAIGPASIYPPGPDPRLEAIRLAVELYTEQSVDESTVLHTADEFYARLTRDREIPPPVAGQILTTLQTITKQMEALVATQDDINQAVAEDNTLLTDLGTQVTAVAAAQAAFATEIASLQGQGVDTSGLVAANAALEAAQAPLDAAVSALTSASTSGGGGTAGTTSTPTAAPTPGTSN